MFQAEAMGYCTYSIDMVDEDRPDEVALTLVLLAEGGPLLLRILHQPLNEVGAALTDHWCNGCIILHWCKPVLSHKSDKQHPLPAPQRCWHCGVHHSAVHFANILHSLTDNRCHGCSMLQHTTSVWCTCKAQSNEQHQK